MYEGTPDTPDWSRWWSIIERYKVTVLYYAPTAIRAHMKQGPQYAQKHDLSSLRLLGTVGEPINPEAWIWYHITSAASAAPVVDTWWQTETGAIMISPLPRDHGDPTRFGDVPASRRRRRRRRSTKATRCRSDGGGYLVLTQTLAVDAARHLWRPGAVQSDLLEPVPGELFPGDGCKRDEDGYYWLLGRVDDVMNVSGHRLSTTEIESALVAHPAWRNRRSSGSPTLTGEAIFAFVILKSGVEPSDALRRSCASTSRR